jgi:hypothetical protein
LQESGRIVMSNPPKKWEVPKVIPLFPGYEVVEFPWGAAIKNCKTKQWENVYFPDGQELNVEKWEIILHDNGIELVSFRK